MIESFTTLLTAALALAGILGVILLLGRAMRHTSLLRPPASGRTLVLTETLALDSRRRLYLVRHGNRAVLLLTGGETDLVVGWLDPPTPP
ncbi:MAG: hypothetical protein EXR07_03420 [Acetobacteraceae bacterium]|nr:hypothetical protein [Acetobacteraceae bacterium]